MQGKLMMQLCDAAACTSMQLNDTTVCNFATQLYAAVLYSYMKLDYATAVTTYFYTLRHNPLTRCVTTP